MDQYYDYEIRHLHTQKTTKPVQHVPTPDMPDCAAAIRKIHCNEWSEALLEPRSMAYLSSVLSEHQLVLVNEKVRYYSEGVSDAEANEIIALLYKVSPNSIKTRLYEIKKSLRLGGNPRVDDWLKAVRSKRFRVYDPSMVIPGKDQRGGWRYLRDEEIR